MCGSCCTSTSRRRQGRYLGPQVYVCRLVSATKELVYLVVVVVVEEQQPKGREDEDGKYLCMPIHTFIPRYGTLWGAPAASSAKTKAVGNHVDQIK